MLIKVYLMAWNALLENKEALMRCWKEQMQSENLLEEYQVEMFIEYTDSAEPLKEMDTDIKLKTLNHIKVFEDGTLRVVFLDGRRLNVKMKKSKRRGRLGVLPFLIGLFCPFSDGKA